jgi:hypothetical protein
MTTTPTIRGSRAQVMHGTAKKTSGGKTKSELKYNARGEIVSRKKSEYAKKHESDQMKLWRKAVKETYKLKKYQNTFEKLKIGSAFYKSVCRTYKGYLEEKFGKTHHIRKKAGSGCKYQLIKKK